MAFTKHTEALLDVQGPGQGQRDSWSGQAKVSGTGSGRVRIELPVGASGRVIEIARGDLAALSHEYPPQDPRW